MSDQFKTKRQILPYEIKPTIVGEKVTIKNTRGQILTVSRDEIFRQLMRDDLDPHRRKMYEAARDALLAVDNMPSPFRGLHHA